MTPFITALRFLTVLPVPGKTSITAQSVARSIPYYPAVGIIIGIIMALICVGADAVFPPLVTSVLLVLVLSVISGGLHLDGLADTSDGLFSARPRNEALSIMKDSSTGVMGVIALVLVLLLKIAALTSLSDAVRWEAAFLIPVAGRCSLVYMLYALPYARSSSSGLGSMFFGRTSTPTVASAALIFTVCALVTTGLPGIALLIIAGLSCFLFTLYIKQRLGGGTGDTTGALAEIVETVTALALAALLV